jgi:signal transduction histidine kinase
MAAGALVGAQWSAQARPCRVGTQARYLRTAEDIERDDVTGSQAGTAYRPLVLLVDDDPSLRRMIAAALAAEYRVATAVDGTDGLAQAVAQPPDLILSDSVMPGMNGEQLLQAIRALPELADVPFLILTGDADEAVRIRALSAGAQDYLSKPISLVEVRARIAIHVALKRARDMLQRELTSTSNDLEGLAREVVERRHEAVAALGVRDEFVREAAHELRTPITNVLGTAQLVMRDLARGVPPDMVRLRRNVGIIEHQAQRIGRLVNHLLDLPHLQGSELAFKRQAVDLVVLAQAAARHVQDTNEDRRLLVREHAPVVATVDEHAITEVLGDLLDNAVKYSPSGGVIEIDISADDPAVARLEVRDHGMGVEPENREHLFERFYQAHPGQHLAGQVGLGLGLYISRLIVEQHGGHIYAEFPPDGGTRVVVCLPTGLS